MLFPKEHRTLLNERNDKANISCLLVANDVVALGAGVLEVLAGVEAEGDETTSEVAADTAENETEDPGHHVDAAFTLGNAILATVGARDLDGLSGPRAGGEWSGLGTWGLDDHHGLLHHLGLLLHHGLLLHGLLHHHGLTLSDLLVLLVLLVLLGVVGA